MPLTIRDVSPCCEAPLVYRCAFCDANVDSDTYTCQRGHPNHALTLVCDDCGEAPVDNETRIKELRAELSAAFPPHAIGCSTCHWTGEIVGEYGPEACEECTP